MENTVPISIGETHLFGSTGSSNRCDTDAARTVVFPNEHLMDVNDVVNRDDGISLASLLSPWIPECRGSFLRQHSYKWAQQNLKIQVPIMEDGMAPKLMHLIRTYYDPTIL